jgi:CheY-like chemotaxis protein
MTKDRKPKILIADDAKENREGLQRVFEDGDYEVVLASDGEEALGLTVSERPDIILCDVMMPRVSGFDVCDIIKSIPELKHIPVILESFLDQKVDIDRAHKVGAVEYIDEHLVDYDGALAIVRKHTPKILK